MGVAEAMPERLGAHLSPSPGQDVLIAHSCVALLTLGPQTRPSMTPSPSGHCLTAGATSKLCREIRPSGHPGLWEACACISECAPPLLCLPLHFLCLSFCFSASPRLLWPHSLPPLLSPSSFLSPSFSNLFSEHDVRPHPILSPSHPIPILSLDCQSQ